MTSGCASATDHYLTASVETCLNEALLRAAEGLGDLANSRLFTAASHAEAISAPAARERAVRACQGAKESCAALIRLATPAPRAWAIECCQHYHGQQFDLMLVCGETELKARISADYYGEKGLAYLTHLSLDRVLGGVDRATELELARWLSDNADAVFDAVLAAKAAN